MENGTGNATRYGWIGVGRMGAALVRRMLEAGHDVAVYNRTRSKAEALEEFGATVVDSPRDLADRDVVFTMVAGPKDFQEVVLGPEGVLSADGIVPRIIVDSTTISPEGSLVVREQAEARGVQLLAAPVSGNPKVVSSGRLSMVVSGPEAAYDELRPIFELLAQRVTYVGEGERARLAKICHNVMLGVVAQCLAEITVVAEKGGISRADFLEFLNNSVMGSVFTRYKTPALVNLEFTPPTFTPELLRKDFDLGLGAGRALDVPMPVSAAAQQAVQALIGHGYDELDFAALLDQTAKASGLELSPENVTVDDGLSPIAPAHAG
jgi:3-hydroxyisobutyrate dehydrogenase-like beta-hydroxyacid dehydrogenase